MFHDGNGTVRRGGVCIIFFFFFMRLLNVSNFEAAAATACYFGETVLFFEIDSRTAVDFGIHDCWKQKIVSRGRRGKSLCEISSVTLVSVRFIARI